MDMMMPSASSQMREQPEFQQSGRLFLLVSLFLLPYSSSSHVHTHVNVQSLHVNFETEVIFIV